MADSKTPLLNTSPASALNRSQPNKYVPVEIVVVLFFLALACLIPIQQYYVISTVANKYNETNFISHGASRCSASITNSTNITLNDDIINKEATEFLMYLGFCSTFLSVIPILILGSVADRRGRKAVICLCLAGLILKEVVYIFVIHFNLSLYFLYIGQIIEGLTGGFGTVTMAIFGMTADITPPGKDRAFRITVIECCAAAILSVATLGMGYWIRYGGFYLPMLFTCFVTVLCAVFVVIFLPETNQFNRHTEHFFTITNLSRFVRLYTENIPFGRRRKLIASLLVLALTGAAIMGRWGTVTLYLINSPICWNEVEVQIFGSVQTFVNWCSVIVVVRVLHIYTPDYGILVIGCTSCALALFVLSFAAKWHWCIYLYVVIGLCSSAIFPMVRSLMSRLCKPDEQGALFSSLSSTEFLFTALSQLLYGGIYKWSESFYPGLAFLVMSVLLAGVVCISILLYRWMKNETCQKETWEAIN